MKAIRATIAAAATLLMTSGVMTLSAGSASALPSQCNSYWGAHRTQAWAQCTAGTGQYRVKIMCDASPDFPSYGAWYAVGSGTPSHATCPGYEEAVAKYYERRGFGL
ncbi:hypothetical protein [Lentzea sp. NPDC060358]|uniref:hypothetical protein n=1 Tax=Lentzea sp. NPDC060358 TaxID=3347103 RepID=UPI003661509B